ncbi:MAG: carbamoyltransferase C-terminal domain-containing protein [bacterium]
MKILGIHSFIHDSGACLMDGGGVCAISEERLSRIKYDAAFPKKAIEYVLARSNISDINQADLAVFDLFERQGKMTELGIRQSGYTGELASVQHHDAHAASAFFCSPFEDAAILVVDGAGSRGDEFVDGGSRFYLNDLGGRTQEVQSIYRGKGNRLHQIRKTYSSSEYAIGVGFLYGLASEFLRFGKLQGGKLMGLAAYGENNKRFRRRIFAGSDGEVLIPFKQEHLESENWDIISRELFGGLPRPAPGVELGQEYADLARYIQEETEAAMVRIARNLYDITGSKNICLAGGVALNGIANMLILERTPFENIFVQPASGDSGIPLGCALYGKHVMKNQPRDWEMRDAYLGGAYDDKGIRQLLKEYKGIKISKLPRVWEDAAREIAAGKIAGWFQGGSEYGPRALGNRSILADPRDPDMKDKLNRRVKLREHFRPYAPSVLEERVAEYFECDRESPFMLLIGHTKPGRAALIPAVVHVDGTARVQTVNSETNGIFYRLIQAFERETGVPMVLNTSFNTSGEPIVENPEHALECFIKTGMDVIYLNSFKITKNIPN